MTSQSLNNGCIGETIPQFSLPSMMLDDMDYLFGQFGLVVPAVSTPNPLLSPSLLLGLGREGAPKKASVLCKHCSAVAKTLARPQHCPKFNCGTTPAAVREPDPVCLSRLWTPLKGLFWGEEGFLTDLIWRTTEASELSAGPRLKATHKHRMESRELAHTCHWAGPAKQRPPEGIQRKVWNLKDWFIQQHPTLSIWA